MKQSVSYYVLDSDKEEELLSRLKTIGLNGIENLIYNYEPSKKPFTKATIGAHLRYWPTWMDFYSGRKEIYRQDYPKDEDLIKCYGGVTSDAWLQHIQLNIKAALAEKPEYLVWHVADCRVIEAWTHQFHYTSEEVLKKTAEIYNIVSHIIPDDVYTLFENIFWPGLCYLTQEEVYCLFSRINRKNVGIMLDTGHYMNVNTDIQTEKEGAECICQMVERLGDMKTLIKGIHLSASFSGKYQKNSKKNPPINPDMSTILKHIAAIDQHRPFETDATRQIVDAVEPRYLTHEIFSNTHDIPLDGLKKQMKYL